MRPIEELKRVIVGEPARPDYVQQQAFALQPEESRREAEFSAMVDSIVKKAQDFSSNETFWTKLLALLEQANDAASEKNWKAAQQYAIQASVLVNRAIRSESLRYARFRLALAPAGWFLLLFWLERLIEWLRAAHLSSFLVAPEYFQYLWLGMVGGTTIVWWGIVKHAKDLTFDSAFVIWYLLKPALGAIMGLTVVLVVKAGFVTLNAESEITNYTPLLVIAFIGGFSERFFVNLIDKVVSAVLGGGGGAQERAPAEAGARKSTLPPASPEGREGYQ